MSDREYVCNISGCVEVFPLKKSYKDHLITTHRAMAVICVFCPGTNLYQRPYLFRQHVQDVHPEAYVMFGKMGLKDGNCVWLAVDPPSFRLACGDVEKGLLSLKMREAALEWSRKQDWWSHTRKQKIGLTTERRLVSPCPVALDDRDTEYDPEQPELDLDYELETIAVDVKKSGATVTLGTARGPVFWEVHI